jgi:hypothetical protein
MALVTVCRQNRPNLLLKELDTRRVGLGRTGGGGKYADASKRQQHKDSTVHRVTFRDVIAN